MRADSCGALGEHWDNLIMEKMLILADLIRGEPPCSSSPPRSLMLSIFIYTL